MSENKMPEFDSIEELTEFFDTHDMSEYLDEMPEAHFDVDIQRRSFLISVDEQLMKQLSEVAKSQHTSTQHLVNEWLKEKIAQAA
jgi:hypothetical protein